MARLQSIGSTLVLAASLAVVGCAKTAAVRHATIDRGYPTRAQLASVLRAPLPPREEALKKGVTVEQWELAGPFPDQAGSVPFTGNDALAQAVAEHIAARGSNVVITDSMQCYAREIGLFLARHGQLPEEDLQAFAAGRCGVVPIAPSFLFSLPPDALPVEAAMKFFEDATLKAAPSSELGVFRASDGDRHVLLATFGDPKVRLVSIDPSPEIASSVRVHGTLLEPAAWLRAYTTEGLLGFHACEPTRQSPSVLPDFDLTCRVAAEDSYAVFDMLTAAPQALLGRQVLMLMLPTGRTLSSTFHRSAGYGVPSRGSLLDQFNAVRAKLGREALHEVAAQSGTAGALVPRYFAAAANGDAANVDFITLGMMAGWDVRGPLRDSQFLSFRGVLGEGVPSFLSQLLFFPSNRAVLLDKDATRVALATMHDEKSHGLWGLLTTYTIFEPRDYPEVETALFDELDRQRQARGKPPVVRIHNTETESILGNIMEKLAEGSTEPRDGLDLALRTFSRRMHRPFNGRAAYALAVEGWRPTFEGALVEDENIAVAGKVGFFAGPGDHWGQYVGYFIFGPTFDVNRGNTIPNRGAR